MTSAYKSRKKCKNKEQTLKIMVNLLKIKTIPKKYRTISKTRDQYIKFMTLETPDPRKAKSSL